MSREENLRSFMQDSHAVDEAGDPLRLYHGTADDFSEFRLHSANKKDAGWLGRGFYFTNSPPLANSYSMIKTGKSPNVMPVHLALKNPFYATQEHKTAIKNALMEDPFAADDFRNQLLDAGHDGVILDYGTKDNVKEYVAFHPEQIKSATGNQGTFDPRDPDITKAQGGEVEDDGITAYHGTPHEFEQFDLSKIGTGEGAQAYGHGLYFAENEDVARGYRDSLSTNKPSPVEIDGQKFHEPTAMQKYVARTGGDPDYVLKQMQPRWDEAAAKYKSLPADADELERMFAEEEHQGAQKQRAEVEAMRGKSVSFGKPGHMYEVRINAHPDHFLDWDKKLNEQSEHVRNAIKNMTEKYGLMIDPKMSGSSLYDEASNTISRTMADSDKEASNALYQHGIRGIRYLDAGSRDGDKAATRNYVVFDDKLVNVRRRYEQGGAVDAEHMATGGEVGNDFIPHGHPDRDANFNTWFGKSTAIDGNGKPLVHYHATARDFSTFKPGGFNPEMSGSAIWLTPYKESQPAGHNVGGFEGKFKEGANVMPVYVKIEKPLFVDDSDPEGKNELRKRFGSKSFAWPMTLDDQDISAIREAGYDGIYHMKHEVDEKYDPETGRGLETIVFSPSQIKSATGNQGTFDPANPNITKATGGEVGDETPYHQMPEFQNWFGDSVAHMDGVPVTYYHGTSKDKDFPSFNVGRHGVWLTSDPEEASQYAEQNDSQNYTYEGGKYVKTNTASRVIPVHLKAENPYLGEKPEELFQQQNYKKAQSDWFDGLRAQGYDSWIPASQNGALAVILKEPTQIKSIYNRKFDPKNKRMDKAVGGEAENPDIPQIDNAMSIFPKPQRMFPEDAPVAGGQYLNAATKEDMTGHKAAMASIGVQPGGKPYFRASPDSVDETGTPGRGSAIAKTNLFKQKAGWKWAQAPEGHEATDTIVSVAHRGQHHYTLNAHFPKGVDLARYENSPTEPRLRPTTKGNVTFGPKVGSILVRGKEHPVYEHVIVKNMGGEVSGKKASGGHVATLRRMSDPAVNEAIRVINRSGSSPRDAVTLSKRLLGRQ